MGSSDALELLESKGFEAVKDVLRRNRELEVMASVGVSLQRAIEQAQKQHSIKEGRRTWHTLLTAAAFGEDEEGGSTMSAERKADAIDWGSQADFQLRGRPCRAVESRSRSNRGEEWRCLLVLIPS